MLHHIKSFYLTKTACSFQNNHSLLCYFRAMLIWLGKTKAEKFQRVTIVELQLQFYCRLTIHTSAVLVYNFGVIASCFC